ncbi:hypothetical protein [Streptomyces reniochalinae]|uniref:DUF8094 domain-containing protein n=1 Tax=Streptomyces reniochalinae TaxID=2250578 RepID=A0A367EBE1_9ACTN|nr:hypothetical protein [Streptomyces reniochalinae]RCG15374.1 hypothetical protein DQ392_24690 [Streptomyces reniochalinae]
MHSWARGTAGLACAGSLVLAAAGCGGSDSARDAAGGGAKAADAEDRPARGVVTRAQAGKIFDRYERINNRANKHSDAKVISQAEAGPLYQESKATFRLQKNWKKKRIEEYKEPFNYIDRKFYIPRKGTADWFVMVAHSKSPGQKKNTYPGIFVMQKKSQGWRLVAASYSDTTKIPRIAQDKDGFAQPVTDPDKKRGALAPSGLSDALFDLYSEEGATESTGFASSKATRWIRKVPKTQNKLLSPYAEAVFSRGESGDEQLHALRTSDGGALALFSTQVREHDRGTQATATIHPSGEMKVYVGETGRPSFFVDWLHQSSAHLPPHGKARLLSSEYIMTGAAPGTDSEGRMPGVTS